MNKEELKALLDSLTIIKIESFEITYTREHNYGYNQDEHTISYNK